MRCSSPDLDRGAYIGYDEEGSGHYFDGTIDGVMVFDKALSADEVKDLYSSFSYDGNGS